MSDAMKRLAESLVEAARRAGALHADALAVSNSGETVRARNGAIEAIEREDSQGVGLRAFVETPRGLAFASASTSDISEAGLARLADKVIAMAKLSEPDPDAVPPVGASHPSEEELAHWKQEHGHDEIPWTLASAREAVLACEETARSYSSEISNSDGADGGFVTARVGYASSDGFAADYARTSASLSVSVIAGSGDGMQRDYAWHRAHNASELRSPISIGTEAAERTVRRLGASECPGGRMPVVFEPRVATSIVGHLVAAVNGKAVLQQRSFLADAMGQPIFPEFVTITDDPESVGGLSNRLFDGEGSRCRKLDLVASGVLQSWLTNRYTAKRLDYAETGHASRGLAGDIGITTSNLILQPGSKTPEQIYREIGNGLLVTELIGFGVNGVTGDYSRGASGFLIENGAIGRPVQGITVAGNLKRIFADISHIGSDAAWLGSSAVPTVAVGQMSVAGQG